MGRQNNRRGKDRSSPSGRLRIVAGKWRSRLLPVADVAGLRPTPERVRETLFNWLSPGIEECRCLDLFAGTGALGLEALSRGAAGVVFVEQSKEAARELQKNIDVLEATGAILNQDDALRFIRTYKGKKFDIVFLDPPFADDLLQDLCRLLAESDSLAPGARVYIEQELGQKAPEMPAGWVKIKEKRAGNVSYALAQVQDTME